MNFSVYFILLAAAVSIAFVQQLSAGVVDKKSETNNQDFEAARLILEKGYSSGKNFFSDSEDMITDAILSAKSIVHRDPEEAKNLLEDAFNDARFTLFKYGVSTVLALGAALSLSNEAAKQGLEEAIILIEKAGFQGIDSLNLAENLFNQGMYAGGQVLLEACQSAVNNGFKISNSIIQESFQTANQALTDAQRTPIRRQAKNGNCETAGTNHPKVFEAIQYINKAAENALKRGAKADLVQKLSKVLKCSISDSVSIAIAGIMTVENLQAAIGIEPLVAKSIFNNVAEAIQKQVYVLAAKIYLVIGDVAFESGNISSNKIEAAIINLIKGVGSINMELETAKDLLDIGLRHQGAALNLALESAIKTASFGKIAFIQVIVECANLMFSALYRIA